MSTGSAPVLVRDNPEALRYELVVDGDIAGEILYRRSPDRIALVHTEVSPSLEGQGLGSRLVAAALDDVPRTRASRCPDLPVRPQLHPAAPGVRRPRRQ
jgi:predicted GNAT family acetyltransferase